jgi:pseudoazurin
MRVSARIVLPLLLALSIFGPGRASAEPRTHLVQVVSDPVGGRMYFDPKVLHVEPGDTVTWVNRAEEEHNVITFPDGYPEGAAAFQSPLFREAGEEWSVTLTVEGSYEYHCLPHLPMGMHGMIIVGRLSAQDEFHVPSPVEVARYRRQMLEWFDSEAEANYHPRAERDHLTGSDVN